MTEGGPHSEELAAIDARIEELQTQATAEAEELGAVKEAIKANDASQAEARAEAAAKRMMLEEDAELRKAIQVSA